MQGLYFMSFLIFSAVGLLVIYLAVKRVLSADDREKAPVSYPTSANQLKKRNNYLAKNSGLAYFQNNNIAINKRIAVLTPTFRYEAFLDFAKEIFEMLAEDGSNGMLDGVVAKDIGLSQMPEKIDRYGNCYLHQLAVSENEEKLSALMVVENDDSKLTERYYITFSRKNSMKNVTRGGVIAVSCPHCGAALSFEQKAMKLCPYCGKPVAYAEYDWVLVSVEHIENDRTVDNRAYVEV